MPYTVEQLMEYFHTDSQALQVISGVEPYIAALIRQISNEQDDELIEQFKEAVAKRSWIDLDELMWPYMTEDERDKLSNDVLQEARQAVMAMAVGEKILRQIIVKIVTYALG